MFLSLSGAKLAIFGHFGQFLAISENVHFKNDEIKLSPIFGMGGQNFFKVGSTFGQ